MMFRRLSIPQRLSEITEKITQFRRRCIAKFLSRPPDFRRSTVDMCCEKAIEETARRLATATERSDLHSRLSQRLNDLVQIRQAFSNHGELEFVGFFGWGEGCDIKTEPFRGISQYDSIVYRYHANGHTVTVTESLASCYQLFHLEQQRPAADRQAPAPFEFDSPNSDAESDQRTPRGITAITASGRVTSVLGIGGAANDDTDAESVHSDPEGTPLLSNRNKTRLHHSHRHGIDTNVSGACVCGRGISQIAAPSSADTHAHESGFSHSVELINGGNFDPSILGLSLAGGLLPIRLGIDVYQYAQLRQLLVRRNALRDQPQSIDAYTAFNRDQLRITNQSIAETRYRLFVSSPVFYSAVGLNIAGQGIGFAGKSGGGALVGVGGIVFGAGLGILGVLEGGYELYRTMGVAPTVSESQTVSNEVKDEYRRELQRALTAKRVKAASKIAGGGLMIIGTFVPGAQPAVIVGMGILMAPAAAQVSRVLKSKLWSETAHVHLRDLDQLDPQCRLWTFDRIRHEINCFDNLRSELKTGTLSPDDLLRRYAASVKEIHGYKKIDAERRYGYIDAQHRLFRSSGNRDATGMDKRISGLLSELRSDISRHNRVVQSLSRTDCPIEEILNTLSETGDLNRWVVPQTRGILKRFWNRKKLQARVDAGLVKEAPHSSIYHRRYQRSETTAATQIWHYLNRDNTIRKKILRFANRDLHHLKHEIRHLCDYEIACQNRPSLPERNCLKPFRIQHQFTRIDVTDD